MTSKNQFCAKCGDPVPDDMNWYCSEECALLGIRPNSALTERGKFPDSTGKVLFSSDLENVGIRIVSENSILHYQNYGWGHIKGLRSKFGDRKQP